MGKKGCQRSTLLKTWNYTHAFKRSFNVKYKRQKEEKKGKLKKKLRTGFEVLSDFDKQKKKGKNESALRPASQKHNQTLMTLFNAVVYQTVSIALSLQMSSAAVYGRSSGECCKLSMHGHTAFIFKSHSPRPLHRV